MDKFIRKWRKVQVLGDNASEDWFWPSGLIFKKSVMYKDKEAWEREEATGRDAITCLGHKWIGNDWKATLRTRANRINNYNEGNLTQRICHRGAMTLRTRNPFLTRERRGRASGRSRIGRQSMTNNWIEILKAVDVIKSEEHNEKEDWRKAGHRRRSRKNAGPIRSAAT